MLSIAEAQQTILSYAKIFPSEIVALNNCFSRILAEDIFADRDYPPFHRSAMDGFAINSGDFPSNEKFKITGNILAGEIYKEKFQPGTAVRIMTGAPVPEGADAVIRVEDASIENDTVRFSISAVKKGANIAAQGEDAGKGELLAGKNQLINGPLMALLATTGKSSLSVYKIPVVVIISTGDEVRPVEENILPHHIRDSNSYALEGFFLDYHIPIKEKMLIPDDKKQLTRAFKKADGADIIILSGGVSMGEADYVPGVLSSCGVKNIFHKVAIKPGKPLWFGVSQDNKVVFGLPGNPMSCQVAYKLFIEPYLRECMGMGAMRIHKLPLTTSRTKKSNLREYFPCRLVNDPFLSLVPVKFNGSGDIRACIGSDGIAAHPADERELKEGSVVEFVFWRAV